MFFVFICSHNSFNGLLLHKAILVILFFLNCELMHTLFRNFSNLYIFFLAVLLDFKFSACFILFHRFAYLISIFLIFFFLFSFLFSLFNFLGFKLSHPFFSFKLLFLKFLFTQIFFSFIFLRNSYHLLSFKLSLTFIFLLLLSSFFFELCKLSSSLLFFPFKFSSSHLK